MSTDKARFSAQIVFTGALHPRAPVSEVQPLKITDLCDRRSSRKQSSNTYLTQKHLSSYNHPTLAIRERGDEEKHRVAPEEFLGREK